MQKNVGDDVASVQSFGYGVFIVFKSFFPWNDICSSSQRN